jgi:hypothetical protein
MESNKADKHGVIISVLFLTFTFCIFGPFQLYITNASELFFSFRDIWWICALIALFSGLFFIIVGLLLKGKLREFYCCILWGIAIGFYIQGNIISVNYGTLDGKVNWEQYNGVGVWNTVIWIVCIISPFIIYKLFPKLWNIIRDYISIGILAVQVIILCLLFIMTDNSFGTDCQLTNFGRFQLSKNENTIVFVLDAYDSQYFSDFIEQHPEYKETLWSDFIFYPDTVGGGARTLIAMPQILTGEYYTSEGSYPDYLEKAYQSTDLYQNLDKAKYNIGIYTQGQFVSPIMKDMIINIKSGKKQVSSYSTLAYYLYRFTACRYFPHELKKNVWMYSGDFDAAVDSSGSDQSSYLINDALFYRDLVENGITLQDDKNAFRLYHLMGAHAPYTLDSQAQRSVTETSLEEQQIGVMHILEAYFDQMKQLGVYDNANIVVLADHGSLNYSQNPLLLIKRGQETKTFTRSDVPVSYTNLHSTLLSFLPKSNRSGKTIFELTHEDNKERFFYMHSADNVTVEYIIRGEASDPDNVHETGKTYRVFASEEPGKYCFGDMLYFDARATGLQYAVKGFSVSEASHTWTDGFEVIMSFPLQKPLRKDAFVSISLLFVANGRQRVEVYINDTFLNNYVVDTNQMNFIIPKEMITNDELVIRFELPDAAQFSTIDPRTFGLAFESMVIREKQSSDAESGIFFRDYHFGDRILFTNERDGTRYFRSGISGIETDFAWSLGKSGQIVLDIENPNEDLTGNFQFKLIYAAPQRLIICSDGQTLYNQEIISTEQSIEFEVPAECVKNGRLVLDLEYPDAVSPESLGKGSDTRQLAFGFSSIRFFEGEV